jgi:hypothetical protein
MTDEDREREFSRRALLRAGWSVPVVLGIGGLAAACGGGGGTHDDLSSEIRDLNKKAGKNTSQTSSSSTTSTSTSTTSTTQAGSSTTATTRGTTGGQPTPHGDVPRNTTRVHTDTPHGDSGAVASPHTDQHGDVPETFHHDALNKDIGLPEDTITPHVDTPHADVPHVDAPHTDFAHGDA